MKVWAVLFVCLNTSSLKIETAPGYSTSDFMIAWRGYTADAGQPSTVHSDPGSQLKKAEKDLNAQLVKTEKDNKDEHEYDWDRIVSDVGPKVKRLRRC